MKEKPFVTVTKPGLIRDSTGENPGRRGYLDAKDRFMKGLATGPKNPSDKGKRFIRDPYQ